MKLIKAVRKIKKGDGEEDKLISLLLVLVRQSIDAQGRCAKTVSQIGPFFSGLTTQQKKTLQDVAEDFEHLANQFEQGAKTIRHKIS